MDGKIKGYSTERLVKFREYQSAYLVDNIGGVDVECFEYYIPADKVAEFKQAGGMIEDARP